MHLRRLADMHFLENPYLRPDKLFHQKHIDTSYIIISTLSHSMGGGVEMTKQKANHVIQQV